ncbi:MAG TPA: hypothetical protein VFV70_12035 [Hyphomonadaceae bacterium]|nr:hypothetical protein [Hyphomonadaceae bacterium]
MQSIPAAIAFSAFLCAAAAAQTPRTPDGHPDLQGVWVADFITPLERPEKIATLVVPPESIAETVKTMTTDPGKVYDPDFDYFFPNTLLTINGEARSSWVVAPDSGRLPMTALARSAAKYDNGFDNPEERPGGERCVSGLGHPPMHAISSVIPSQIVQTPAALVFVTEDTDSTRIVDLSGPKRPDAIRTRMGSSSGRWEGDTLVVETAGFSAPDPAGVLMRDAVALSEASRVTERFTLISQDELLYRFTVEDPALYDRPWLAEYMMTRNRDRLHEYACHEGNRAMENILTAARLGKQKPSPDR